jgi:tRNA threonylcarbamoyladenosine biosynthesis protein TsaB
MLILAFDTATDVATSALVDDGEVLGERVSRAVTLLEDVDALLRQAGARTGDLDALAVGIGPGSFTGVRIGLATARGLAFGLDLPVAGVSTLAALAAGAPGATPVIDARRRPETSWSAAAPFAIETSSKLRAPSYRPTTTSATSREPASTPSSPAASRPPRTSSRSTSGHPTLIERDRERHGQQSCLQAPRAP